jgi:hypothetical protein
MKYYSELTQKVYNTEAECKKAEQAFNFELEQKARAEEQKKLAEKKKQEEMRNASRRQITNQW